MVLMGMRVFMSMLVGMFTGNFMLMGVAVLALMRVCVSMRMRVAVRMRRLCPMRMLRMIVLVCPFGLMRMLRRRIVAGHHVNFGSCDAAAAHFAHLKARTYIQCGGRLLKQAERNACIHKGAKQHVAADAGKTFQISNAHWSRILNG